MTKVRIVQYFFTNTLAIGTRLFIENRPGSKWLCSSENGALLSKIKISKASYTLLMKYANGVSCQMYVDALPTDGEEDPYETTEDYWDKYQRNLPAVVKKAAPFIVQVFIPS